MSRSEVAAVLPAFASRAAKDDIINPKPADLAGLKAFANVNAIALAFFDDRVYFMTVIYKETPFTDIKDSFR